jgi:hypothetical protein
LPANTSSAAASFCNLSFLQAVAPLRDAYRSAETLVAKLHAMRKAIGPERSWLHDEAAAYEVSDE